MESKQASGKTMYMWSLKQCANGNPKLAQAMAHGAGFRGVVIKAWDGAYEYRPNKQLLPDFVAAFKEIGIEVYLWGYNYGTWVDRGGNFRSQALAEARVTVRMVEKYQPLGIWNDAEVQYKRPRSDRNARIYQAHLLQELGADYPIALSSYRYPKLHPEFPFSEFMKGAGTYHAQQMYWMGDNRLDGPEKQLARSINELRQIKVAPFIPVGVAAAEHGWAPTNQQLQNFMNACVNQDCLGFSFWSWQHAESEGYWQTIANFDWPNGGTTPPPPPPPPPPPVTLETLDARVTDLEEEARGHGWDV